MEILIEYITSWSVIYGEKFMLLSFMLPLLRFPRGSCWAFKNFLHINQSDGLFYVYVEIMAKNIFRENMKNIS
jgi:hypothetical protein